jgi:hypothetical protein
MRSYDTRTGSASRYAERKADPQSPHGSRLRGRCLKAITDFTARSFCIAALQLGQGFFSLGAPPLRKPSPLLDEAVSNAAKMGRIAVSPQPRHLPLLF